MSFRLIPTRQACFRLIVLTAAVIAVAERTLAQYSPSVEPVHAVAMHGDPKHGSNFRHFDYVNPDALKGGSLRIGRRGTFDSFHPYITKGNATGTGSVETLMTNNAEEVFTNYGLIAESVEVPDDRSWVIFNINEKARWHDGKPITADDVVFSFEMITEHHTSYKDYYSEVEKAEKLGERRVGFTFKNDQNRELPLILGQLPVLPKHYWADRDFSKTTLEPPLGSGPYRIKEFEAGRYVILERVEDYWGKDLPVNSGINNFDEIRADYYRDDTAIRLALKSGVIDYHDENQAKAWAADYDVPAVDKGWLVKELAPHRRPTGLFAFIMNSRRDIFSDVRVRKALGYAFDFEWTNRTLFYSAYTRTESFFSNSDFASNGLPQGEEREILEQYREQLPSEIFAGSYRAPRTDGSGWPRENLTTASELLDEAGWVIRDLKRVNEQTGQPLAFEMLLVSPSFERICLPFVRNLAKLGIDARVRLVDESQYINRIGMFDYDVIISGWGQSDSPGNEQLSFWSSLAADTPRSRNFAGIKDPVVDELIELVIKAPSRESLIQRTRALDRVLLAGYYVIPAWHLKSDRLIYWDKFSRPSAPMKNGEATSRWWIDPTKVSLLEQAMADDEVSLSASVEELPARSTTWIAALALIVVGVLLFGIRERQHEDTV